MQQPTIIPPTHHRRNRPTENGILFLLPFATCSSLSNNLHRSVYVLFVDQLLYCTAIGGRPSVAQRSQMWFESAEAQQQCIVALDVRNCVGPTVRNEGRLWYCTVGFSLHSATKSPNNWTRKQQQNRRGRHRSEKEASQGF